MMNIQLSKKLFNYRCNANTFYQIIQASKLMLLNNHHIILPTITHSDKIIWSFSSYSTLIQLINLWKYKKLYITIQLIK
jgi:hypothetical protein